MSQSTGVRPNADNTEIEDSQPQDIPGLPDRAAGHGEMPQMPDGDFDGGGTPQIPGGGFTDGEMPQMRDDGFMRGGNRRGGDQFMQWGQDQDWAQSGASGEASAVSSDALILTGVSALVLLAGILFAVKVKH